MAYLSGDQVIFTVDFNTVATGALVDPTAISFYSTYLGVSSSTLLYSAATTPSVGVLARISTGIYQTIVNVPSGYGTLTGYWTATGVGASAVTDSITVGQSSGSGNLFSDMVENVYRRATTSVRERTVTCASPIGSTTTTFALTGNQTNGIVPGAELAVDLEVMYVLSWDGTNVTVVRGWKGSVPFSHAANATYYINPRFSRWDIGVAINDELRDLSNPDNGLFRVGAATITYNPVYDGYDLSDVPDRFLNILRIRAKTPTPARNFPRIKKYEIVRGIPDPVFPSRNALILKEGAFPGQPMYVIYAAPFLPLLALSDDATNTPATNDTDPPANGYTTSNTPNFSGTVDNLASSMIDIPPLGALIRLTLPREIARNFLESQPDARKALEVPAGSIGNSVAGLITQRRDRIQGEANRLYRQYPLPARY